MNIMQIFTRPWSQNGGTNQTLTSAYQYIHTYIHVSFKSDTFFRLSFCAVSLNASNDSSEPYTVIPIVVALYRGSIFKLCVFLWCIFQNIREGCKVAIIYYFFTKSFTQTVYDSVKHVGLRYWLCFMFSFVLSSFLPDFFDTSFRIIPEKKTC